MLRDYFIPELRTRGITPQQSVVSARWATCHASSASMAVLRQHFPRRLGMLNGLHGHLVFFYLLGYLKDKVYVDKPRTLKALSDAIIRKILTVSRAVLQRSIDIFTRRLQKNVHHHIK